jgi:hypothetical protein
MTTAETYLTKIRQAEVDGKEVYVCTHLKATRITQAAFAKWRKAGRDLFKLSKDGALLMANGKKYVRLTSGADIPLVRIIYVS